MNGLASGARQVHSATNPIHWACMKGGVAPILVVRIDVRNLKDFWNAILLVTSSVDVLRSETISMQLNVPDIHNAHARFQSPLRGGRRSYRLLALEQGVRNS